ATVCPPIPPAAAWQEKDLYYQERCFSHQEKELSYKGTWPSLSNAPSARGEITTSRQPASTRQPQAGSRLLVKQHQQNTDE
ncbi:unnamed protein product, partial [Polarella glacialis]